MTHREYLRALGDEWEQLAGKGWRFWWPFGRRARKGRLLARRLIILHDRWRAQGIDLDTKMELRPPSKPWTPVYTERGQEAD